MIMCQHSAGSRHAHWQHPRYEFLQEVAVDERLAPRRYSRVFRAFDHLSQQLVAVKQARISTLTREERAFGRIFFEREARLLRTTNHPHLVRLLDTFEETGRMHLVLEWVEGMSLEECLLELPLPSLPCICRWAIQVCEGLAYLHDQEHPIVHRDLKPANIMVRPNNDIVLIDLSVARRLSYSFPYSLFGSELSRAVVRTPGDTYPIGTQGYMAPEQFEGYSSPRSDLYSLGVLLHQLLSGDDPTRKPDAEHWTYSVLADSVPPLVRELVTRLLHPLVCARLGNAYEVARVFTSVLSTLA